MAHGGKLISQKSVILDIPTISGPTYGSQSTNDICFSEYYYALVFPNTPHDLADVANERITFEEAQAIIRSVTCGGEANTEHALTEFVQAWVDKFRCMPPVNSDSIPLVYFRELMRNIVIQRLESIPGLTLVSFTSSLMKTKDSHQNDSKEKDAKYIYCLIRINREFLFQRADESNILLPIWPEIDPGVEYWDSHSAEVVWKIDEAEQELNRMFLEGLIQADEAHVYDGETSAMVSRRIHALQRIGDHAIELFYPPSSQLYFPFRKNEAYQYLYRHLESSQTNMPFRMIDKIRVTKSILEEEFNLDMLQQKEFLAHHMCLHTRDPSEEDETLEKLCDQWGSLAAYWYSWEHGACRSLLHLSYYQPIPLIRNYFGEQLAMYFAFLSFYAEMLLPLVVLGLVAPLMKLVLSAHQLVYYNTGLSLFNCFYAARLLRKWNVTQQHFACSWGLEEVKFDNSVRAEYTGILRISPVNNLPEIYAPPYSQFLRRFQSMLMFILAIVIDGALIYGVFALQAYFESQYTSESLGVYTNIAMSFIINLSQIPLHTVVVYLNDWDNHRTNNQYDVSLTVKFTTFQTLNYFGPIVFSMTFKPYLFGCNNTKFPHLDAASCGAETSNLLMVVLLFNLVLSIRDIAGPIWDSLMHAFRKKYYQLTRLSTTIETPSLDTEVELEEYEGVLFDYAQIAVTFGYVSWFAAACPQVAIVAFAITVVQIRVDAYKLCFWMQRPFPVPDASIGGWAIYFHMICLGGVVVNAANVIMEEMLRDHAHTPIDQIPMENWLNHLFKWTIFMGILYAVSLFMRLNDASDHAKLHHIRSVQKREEYLRNVYLYQLASSQKRQVERPSGEIYLNGIYRYVISGDVEDGDQVEELREELQVLERAMILERPNDADFIGTLHLVVVGANILPVMDMSTKALDAFIKIKLKLGEKILSSKHTTGVKRKQRSPVWNETFEFKIVSLDTVVHMEIMDWNMVGKSDKVGYANLPIAKILPTEIHFDSTQLQGSCDMVVVDIPIDLVDGLLETMAKDIPKFGRPVINVSMGIKLNEAGCQHLRHHNRKLRVKEILSEMQSYLVWKTEE